MAYSNVVNVSFTTASDEVVLSADGLVSTSAVASAAVAVDYQLQADGLVSTSAAASAAVAVDYQLQAAGLTSSSAVQGGTVSIPYSITDVYAEQTGEAPIYWMETAVAEGNFGPNEGLVWVHTSRATVISWTASRIEFTPVPNGLPAGTYDVHVDRVL